MGRMVHHGTTGLHVVRIVHTPSLLTLLAGQKNDLRANIWLLFERRPNIGCSRAFRLLFACCWRLFVRKIWQPGEGRPPVDKADGQYTIDAINMKSTTSDGSAATRRGGRVDEQCDGRRRRQWNGECLTSHRHNVDPTGQPEPWPSKLRLI